MNFFKNFGSTPRQVKTFSSNKKFPNYLKLLIYWIQWFDWLTNFQICTHYNFWTSNALLNMGPYLNSEIIDALKMCAKFSARKVRLFIMFLLVPHKKSFIIEIKLIANRFGTQSQFFLLFVSSFLNVFIHLLAM